MAQDKLKKKAKTQLPKGVKQKKIKKVKPFTGPKKGTYVTAPAKKAGAVIQAKVSSTVSRIINEKNEHMVRICANKSQGRASSSKK